MHLLAYATCIPLHTLLAVQERESQLVSARIVLMLPHQLVGRPSSRRSRALVWTEHSIHLDVRKCWYQIWPGSGALFLSICLNS